MLIHINILSDHLNYYMQYRLSNHSYIYFNHQMFFHNNYLPNHFYNVMYY